MHIGHSASSHSLCCAAVSVSAFAILNKFSVFVIFTKLHRNHCGLSACLPLPHSESPCACRTGRLPETHGPRRGCVPCRTPAGRSRSHSHGRAAPRKLVQTRIDSSYLLTCSGGGRSWGLGVGVRPRLDEDDGDREEGVVGIAADGRMRGSG